VYSVTQYRLNQNVLYSHTVTRFQVTQRSYEKYGIPCADFHKNHCLHISYITFNKNWKINVGSTDTYFIYARQCVKDDFH